MQPQGTVSVVQLTPSNTSSNENVGGSVAKETTSVNPLHLMKAAPPMVSNAFPNVNDVNPLQLWKALGPMFLTVLGMVSEPVKPEHPQNAEVPMEVTELPIVKLEKPEHL